MAFVVTRESKLTVRIATVRDFHSMITVPRCDSIWYYIIIIIIISVNDSQSNDRKGFFGLTNTYMAEFNIVDK